MNSLVEMDARNGVTDAQVRQWLCEVFPTMVRGADLPQYAGRAADQSVEIIPVETALRWLDMLGAGKSDEIRLMVQNIPDAAARLATPEGQQIIRDCEATRQFVPQLQALEQAVKTVLAYWRAGGHPKRAVIRTLAALSVSEVVPGGEPFRKELAAIIGVGQSSAASLIGKYASIVADDGEKVESIDRLVSHSSLFGAWIRSFWLCLRLRIQERKGTAATHFDSRQPLWRLSLILREIAGRKGKAVPDR